MEKKITLVEKFNAVMEVAPSTLEVNGMEFDVKEFLQNEIDKLQRKSASRKPKDTTVDDNIKVAILEALEGVDSPKSATELANLVGFVEGYEKALTSQKVLAPLKALVTENKVKVETVKRVNVYSLA